MLLVGFALLARLDTGSTLNETTRDMIVVGVGLDLFLIPRWGAFGAAAAVAAAEWSLLVVSLSFSSDLLGFAVPARRLSETEVTSCS